MVMDANNKPKYLNHANRDDTRQASGYARSTKVHERLGKTDPKSIDCLIIYPLKNGHADLDTVNLILEPMDKYEVFL